MACNIRCLRSCRFSSPCRSLTGEFRAETKMRRAKLQRSRPYPKAKAGGDRLLVTHNCPIGSAYFGDTPWIVLTYVRNRCHHAQHLALSIPVRAQTRSPWKREGAERSRRLRSQQTERQAHERKSSDAICKGSQKP